MRLLLSEVTPRLIHRNNSPSLFVARNSAARLSLLLKAQYHHHHYCHNRLGPHRHAVPGIGKQSLGTTNLRQFHFKRKILPPPVEQMTSELFAMQLGMVDENKNGRKRAQSDSNSRNDLYNGMGRAKRQMKYGGGKKKRIKKREKDMINGTNEDVLTIDLETLRASLEEIDEAGGQEAGEDTTKEPAVLPEEGTEIEIDVVDISSTGEALAVQKGSKQIYVTNFSVPGDTIKAKIYRHHETHSIADFISVVTPAPTRDDSRIQCKYFAQCGGCQYQMLDYAEQLRFKKRVVEKAFRNFSRLPPELLPPVQDTIGSPLLYGYRTKLTPHFDGPYGWKKAKMGEKPNFQSVPDIGFMMKQKRTTMDIEDCPIGTDAVRAGLKRERSRMAKDYARYTKGATLLLRESTQRIPKNAGEFLPAKVENDEYAIKEENEKYIDVKTCVTDNNGVSTEYVGDYIFHNQAGSFFQNNNSILPSFTDHIRELLTAPSPGSSSPSSSDLHEKPIKYLVDAYSGSGLFTICLSSRISDEGEGVSSTGIDISPHSIEFARRNAQANNLPASRAKFIHADAKDLFDDVALGGKATGWLEGKGGEWGGVGGGGGGEQQGKYDPDHTVVVVDPPRKGCDESFLTQLLRFGPRRVVYVSCNVHTQARDVGFLVRGLEVDGEKDGEKKKVNYSVDSLRGFDFFPQTYHVEGVAVLNRVD